MVLYHGSQKLIKKPYYGGGRAANDYGRGFYCTESESLACEWAVSEKHDGYANCYEFRDDGLSVLDLNGPGYTILHWLAVLLRHRTFDARYGIATLAKQYLLENFSVDVEAYDVVRGYRADDSYFSFARTFLSGALSYANLSRAIRLGNLGLQVVAKSRKAFDALAFTSATPATRPDFLASKERRDTAARQEFQRLKAQPFDPNGLYMLNILQGRIGPDDPRLQ